MKEYYPSFIKWFETNSSLVKKIKDWLIDDVRKETKKNFSDNIIQEAIWIIWLIDENDFYFVDKNLPLTWLIISGYLEFSLTLRNSWYEIVENQEIFISMLYDSLIDILKTEINYLMFSNEEKQAFKKYFYPAGRFTYVGEFNEKLTLLKKQLLIPPADRKKFFVHLNNNSFFSRKIDELNEFLKERKVFSNFRNAIVHPETRIMHIVNAEQVFREYINSDKTTKSIEKRSVSNIIDAKYIIERHTPNEFVVSDINDNVERILNHQRSAILELYKLDENTALKIKRDFYKIIYHIETKLKYGIYYE